MEPKPNEEELATMRELIKTNKKLAHGIPLWRAFLVGTIYGIGASIGAAIVIALLSSVLNGLSGINFFKPAVNSVLPYVQNKAKPVAPVIDDLPTPVYVAPSAEPSPSPSPSDSPSPTPSPSPKTSPKVSPPPAE